MQYCHDYYPSRIKLCEESGLSFLKVAPRYGSTLQVVEGKIQKEKIAGVVSSDRTFRKSIGAGMQGFSQPFMSSVLFSKQRFS